jgi:putative MATE family efflux protein
MNLQSPPSSVRDHTPATLCGSELETPIPRQPAVERAAGLNAVALDEKALRRAIIYFVAPQTAGAMLQLVSSTITIVYFGQLLGPSAVAVASVFFPVFLLLVSVLIGLISSGGVVLVGRAYGARDIPQVKRVAGTTLCVCALLSLAIAVLGYWLSPELLGIMQTPPDIQSAAVNYARVTFASLPVLTMFFAYTYLLRGTGDSQTPFLAMALSVAIALILTPALIEGWLGLPTLGSASAPWANLAACAISLPILLVYLWARGHPLTFDRILIRRLWIDWKIAGAFLGIGLPASVQLAMTSLSEVAVVSLVNGFGSSATAAYGAMNQIVGYVLAPVQSVSVAATVFAAQVIGARQAGRIGMVTRTANVLSISIGLFAVGAVYLFAQDILSWFITDPVTQSIAWRALLITLWSYVLVGVGNVLAGVMRATGDVIWPAVISIGAIWLVELPAAYLLSRRIGIDGLWIGYPAGFVTALLAQWIYYEFVWRRRIQHTSP